MACDNPAEPLLLSITNNTVTEDGASAARGIAIGLGNPQQVLSLLPAVSISDLFVFNAADCESSSDNACIAVKGGVFSPRDSETYAVTTESQWNGTEEHLDGLGSFIFFNDLLRYGSDGVTYGFPAFLNQPGQGTQAALPLGANSTFVRAVYESGQAPSQVWGLWPGTRNIYEPEEGLLVIGGYDSARVAGPWTVFPTLDGCPTCVTVDEMSYEWEGGSTSLLADSSDSLYVGLEPFKRLISLPQDMFEIFAEVTSGTFDPDLQLLTYGNVYPPSGNISVTLSNGYQTTMLSQELFSRPREYDSEGVYTISDDTLMISLISNDTSPRYVASWGMPFLTMNYILVDHANQEWKMAPAIRGPASSIDSPRISTICGPALTSTTNSIASTASTASTASATSSTTSTSAPVQKIRVGTIVGGVVGGILGLALILLGFGYLFWRSKRKNRAANQATQPTEPPEYGQDPELDGHGGIPKPAVPEAGDPRTSVWTNSGTTQYSELATPPQPGSEFSQSSQHLGLQQKQETIHEEESTPFMGVRRKPINEPVELPTDRN